MEPSRNTDPIRLPLPPNNMFAVMQPKWLWPFRYCCHSNFLRYVYFVSLCCNAACSVFSDRLADDKDMESFVAILTEKLGLLFDQTFHNICPGKQPPTFGKKRCFQLYHSWFCHLEVLTLMASDWWAVYFCEYTKVFCSGTISLVLACYLHRRWFLMT